MTHAPKHRHADLTRSHFLLYSLFTVGGGPSVLLPQMRQDSVLQHHLLTDRSLTEILAVAQAARVQIS